MTRSSRSTQRVVSASLGIAVSAALLWWAARGVDFDSVITHAKQARLLPLLIAIVVATVTFPLRLVRWRLLLRDDQGGVLPAAPLWHAVAIGFMANNLLPFRAGELLRVFTATRLAGTRFTATISSLAVERIFDGLTVVGLLVFALFASGLPSDVAVGGVSVNRVANVAGAIALVGLLGATFVAAFPLVAERLVRRLVPSPGLADRIVGLIGGIRQGLTALRSPSRLAGVIFWSLVLWLTNALAFYICFDAFGISAPFVGALLLQGLLALGIALPSTPGFIGPFEAAIVAALGLYGVPKDIAFSYALTFHITTFFPIILLGAWSLITTPMQLSDLRRSAS